MGLRSRLAVAIVLAVALGGFALGCATSNSAGTTAAPAPATSTSETHTITSVTQQAQPEPTGGGWLGRFIGEVGGAGITVLEASVGPGRTNEPGQLCVKVHGAKGQDRAVYQATADTILHLAEKCKQELYFDNLQVAIYTGDGEMLYEHTYQVLPPVTTTSEHR